jgi:hypothetical protein
MHEKVSPTLTILHMEKSNAILHGNKLNFTVVACSWYSIAITLLSVHANENCLGHKRVGGTWSSCIRFQSNTSFGLIIILTGEICA